MSYDRTRSCEVVQNVTDKLSEFTHFINASEHRRNLLTIAIVHRESSAGSVAGGGNITDIARIGGFQASLEQEME